MRPHSSNTSQSTAFLVLVGAALALGTAPILVRLAEDAGVGPSATAFWRLLFALGPLALFTALEPRRDTREDVAPDPRRALLYAVLAGVCFAGDLITWHAGIVRTTAANATLLPNLSPLVVAFAAWVFFKERPGLLLLTALAVTLAGAALLSGATMAAADPGEAPERALGDALSAATAVWYAGYILAVKAARRAWPTGRVMAVSTLVSLPLCLLAALVFGEPLLPLAPLGWLWLAALAAIAHLGGQGGLAFALGRLPAALSSLVIVIQPVAAGAAAWALFGEALGPVQLAGAVLVIVGVVLAQREGRRRQSP